MSIGYISGQALMQEAKEGINNQFLITGFSISREAQLFVGWVSGSVTHAGVGFHASTQPTDH